MNKSFVPTFEIDYRKKVKVGNEEVGMDALTTGKIFVVDGHQFQMLTDKVVFSKVPVGGRFRSDGRWCKRTGENNSLYLDPNMPLADTCGLIASIDTLKKVDLLEVTYRGPVVSSNETQGTAHA